MTSFATAGGGGILPPTVLYNGYAHIYNQQTVVDTFFPVQKYSYTPGALDTALDVTGGGYLNLSCFTSDLVGSTNPRVIVTIDGVVVLDYTQAGSINYNGLTQAGAVMLRQGYYAACSFAMIRFNKSLKVQVECDDAAYYYYNYYLT